VTFPLWYISIARSRTLAASLALVILRFIEEDQ
jgi:hypothetical protein